MTSDKTADCVNAICELPFEQQAICMLIAAQMSLPVWQKWAQHQGIADLSEALITCFNRWLNHQVTSDELNEVANIFFKTLPTDLREVDDPAGGYGGYALYDIPMIALDRCEDVHFDMFYTGILYSAAAFCGIGHEAIWGESERLTEAELRFIANWWKQCCEQFPSLVENYKNSIR